MKKRGLPLVDKFPPTPSVQAFWKGKKCDTCDYCIGGECYLFPPLTQCEAYRIGQDDVVVIRPIVYGLSACGQWKERHDE
ncbi:MAG: hypothetical protein WC455_25860 [Dehalococcoidia bacterium]|jgi:hypothetical protein